MENKTNEPLRAELISLADALEALLSDPGETSKEELRQFRHKAERVLQESRRRLAVTGEAFARQTREVSVGADDYVHQNPWTGMGIGAALGVVLGVLLARR